MRRAILALLLLAGSVSVVAQTVQQQLQTIRSRMTGGFLNNSYGEATTAADGFSLLQADGSFSDALSTEVVLTGRLTRMAQSYVQGNYLGMTAVQYRDKMYDAMTWWIDNHPDWKWTGSAMVQPRYVGAILLGLYDGMVTDRAAGNSKVDVLITKAKDFNHWCWLMGGTITEQDITPESDANRGGNLGYRLWGMLAISVVTDEVAEMDWVYERVGRGFTSELPTAGFSPVSPAPDGSRYQHNHSGVQHYAIGYGRDWWNNVINYGDYTVGTNWGLTNAQLNGMADFTLDCMQWVFYKGQGIHSLAGRHNLIRNAAQENGYLTIMANRLNTLRSNTPGGSLSRQSELDAMVARLGAGNEITQTKYFWNSDLMIHSRADYMIALKMASERTSGPESGSGLGKLNYHFADGTTLIYQSGDDYENARVGWNFQALPGTTCEQKTEALPTCDWGRNLESGNPFAGGMVVGNTGFAAFQLNRLHDYHTVAAKKAYFFEDQGITCLGNSVAQEASSGDEILTTLNQEEWKTAVTYSINGGGEVVANTGTPLTQSWQISQKSWFFHNDIGYIIYAQGGNSEVRLQLENRTGDWSDLDNRYQPGDTESVGIFQLSVVHASNSAYMYSVHPGMNLNDFRTFAANQSTPLSNQSTVQAVKTNGESKWRAAYHEAASLQLEAGLTIAADAPVLLQVSQNAEGQIQFYAVDPLQTQTQVVLTVSGELESGPGISYNSSNNTSTVQISFPQGMMTGMPMNVVAQRPRDYVFTEDFESGSLGAWSGTSVDQTGGGGFGATQPDIAWHPHASAYGKYARCYGNKQLQDDWLISPSADLRGGKGKRFSFESASRWGTDASNQMQLLVSTNYNGSGQIQDIQNATWTDLSGQITWAPTPGPTYDWHFSGEVDVTSYNQNGVYFAFRLQADGTNNATRVWHIDDIRLWRTVVDEIAPVAQFNASTTTVTEGNSVSFQDQSLNGPVQWEWTFEGGTPAVSNQSNPNVQYQTAGTYAVTLRVTNGAGSDEKTMQGMITVNEPAPVSYCSAYASNSNYMYLNRVKMGNVDHTSGNNQGFGDFTSQVVQANPGQQIPIAIYPGYPFYNYTMKYRVYIDFNQDGDFNDAGELAMSQNSTQNSVSGQISVPASAASGMTRVRIVGAYYYSNTGACDVVSYGEVEDYTMQISGSAPLSSVAVEASDIRLYPNPAREWLNISITGVTYEIFDLAGRKMDQGEISNGRLFVGELPEGYYQLRVFSENQAKVLRFLKTAN